MIEPKIIVSDELNTDIQNGEKTNYMFRMYRKELGGWYQNTVCKIAGGGALQANGKSAALTVTELLRIAPAKEGYLSVLNLSEHIEHLNRNAIAAGLPTVDEAEVTLGLTELVKLEREAVGENTYLCACMMITADDGSVFEAAVKNAEFTITLEKQAEAIMPPLKLMTEKDCPVAELKNGTALTGYCEYQSARIAKKQGCDGVLWLDNIYNKYILGYAGGGLFVRMGEGAVCPKGDDVMTKSVTELMESWGIDCKTRTVSLDELMDAYIKGELYEAFVTDDVTPVRPVTLIDCGGKLIELPVGKLARKVNDNILSAQKGALAITGIKTEII